jgi:hypothetical protein
MDNIETKEQLLKVLTLVDEFLHYLLDYAKTHDIPIPHQLEFHIFQAISDWEEYKNNESTNSNREVDRRPFRKLYIW